MHHRISPIVITSFVIVCLVFGALLFSQRELMALAPNKGVVAKYRQFLPSIGTRKTAIEPRLSLEAIFTSDHSWLDSLSKDNLRTLVVTGDVLMARSVNAKNVATNDFTRPFLKTADVLKEADLAFINLETPLTSNCPLTNEGMRFCGDLRSTEGLAFAGVDVANLANNHGANYGLKGLEETQKVLTDSGIASSGLLGPVYKEVRGQTFAFLGYNDVGREIGVAAAEKDKITADIAEAKRKAGSIIVTFHWGDEYKAQPNKRQKELGRFTIDAGADVVISNHSHWIQPIELYNNKVIAYALGNFIFDQTWSAKTQEGVLARLTYDETSLIDLEFLPVQISSFGQAELMTGEKKERILREMLLESQKLVEID